MLSGRSWREIRLFWETGLQWPLIPPKEPKPIGTPTGALYRRMTAAEKAQLEREIWPFSELATEGGGPGPQADETESVPVNIRWILDHYLPRWAGDPDLAVIQQAAREGDDLAFTELICRFGYASYWWAVHASPDSMADHYAEDATQEAWLSTWLNVGRMRRAFGPWLKRTVSNKTHDADRAQTLVEKQLGRYGLVELRIEGKGQRHSADYSFNEELEYPDEPNSSNCRDPLKLVEEAEERDEIMKRFEDAMVKTILNMPLKPRRVFIDKWFVGLADVTVGAWERMSEAAVRQNFSRARRVIETRLAHYMPNVTNRAI